jgi:hypothetical protein
MTQPRHGSWSFYIAALGLAFALGTALVLALGLAPLVNVAFGIVVAVFFVFWFMALHGRSKVPSSASKQMHRSWKRAWPKRRREPWRGCQRINP